MRRRADLAQAALDLQQKALSQSPILPPSYLFLFTAQTIGSMAARGRNLRLRNYTLGPPLETYGPNVRVIAILLVLALLFCWLSFAVAIDLRDPTPCFLFYPFTAP